MDSRPSGSVISRPAGLFATAIMSLLAAAAVAGPTPKLTVLSERDDSLGRARQFVVHSALAGHDFVVVVSPPPVFGSWVSADLKAAGSRRPPRKLPGIYALDGGYGIAGPVAQMMAGVGAASPAYVVSVGYAGDQARWHNTDLLHRSVSEGGVTYGGGGAQFQAFLTRELRPFIEARYPLDPTRAILFGHSFGGLFAANVLAEGASRLSAILTAVPSSFRVETRVFAGEGHISYYPLLMQAALEWLLPPPGANRTAVTLSPEALQRIAGAYELADGRVVTVTLKAAKAFVQVTGMPGESELLAQNAQQFFLPGGYNVLMTFEGPMDTRATALVVDMNGTKLSGRRRTQ